MIHLKKEKTSPVHDHDLPVMMFPPITPLSSRLDFEFETSGDLVFLS